MKTYRFFLTRHYIAVQWYDVDAETPAKARRKAVAAANKLRPDPRSEATDNGWIPDVGVELHAAEAARHRKRYEMVEVRPGVFRATI